MRYLFIAAFLSGLMSGQKTEVKPVNTQLKKELAQIYKDDQIYRELMSPINSERRREIMAEKNLTQADMGAELSKRMDDQDRENLAKVEKIIKKYGYPGKTMVGEPENKAVWYVIQHSPEIEKYLPIIKKAADEKELPFRLYAMMLDRKLMQENKEQIYGTQARSYRVTKDGKQQSEWMIWPIQNPDYVNKLRQEAGIGGTVEEYAKDLTGTEYKKYTLKEALELMKGE